MKNKVLKMVGLYLAITLLAFLVYYVTLPAINIYSVGFWVFLTFLTAIYLAPFAVRITKKSVRITKNKVHSDIDLPFDFKVNKLIFLAVIPIIVVIFGSIASSTAFNARAYASVISVQERVFEEDMPETTNVTNVALMDTPSAQIIGNRTLGSLSDVVSQYEVSQEYNQINYMNTPKKVANLEYADFFKWLGNKASGIPGYVMVDPVKNTAEYIKLDKPMVYAESAYFGSDLMRKLRFSYPTKILGTPRYEIDDNGKPYWIIPTHKKEAIIFDPCTGDSIIYNLDEIPEWVDIVYDGNLATEKYNWYGTLSGGFFNSIIGNKGCKQTTNDYGYLALDNDVWYFTGVTSVTGDESNIGFILSNARTGEYKYYSVIGAEEYSAMGAAEGEVQEKGYKASFPALVNISGEATYIMVLKDTNGLVKLFALVNVEDYSSIVAIGESQQQAMNAYKKLLAEKGILSGGVTADMKEITILSITQTVIDGNTVFFYETKNTDGQTEYYRIAISEDESAIFIKVGDTIKVNSINSATDGIYIITEWEYLS